MCRSRSPRFFCSDQTPKRPILLCHLPWSSFFDERPKDAPDTVGGWPSRQVRPISPIPNVGLPVLWYRASAVSCNERSVSKCCLPIIVCYLGLLLFLLSVYLGDTIGVVCFSRSAISLSSVQHGLALTVRMYRAMEDLVWECARHLGLCGRMALNDTVWCGIER